MLFCPLHCPLIQILKNMDCKERYYELIGEIKACPIADFAWSSLSAEDRKYVTEKDFVTEEEKAFRIPMKKRSGSLKETASVEVAGQSYEVTVSWTVEDVDEEVYEMLERLKDNNVLIVNTFGDRPMLVVPEGYGYLFTYGESDGELECKLTAYSTVGTRRIL